MSSGSLRWRLMLGAAITMLATLTLALFAMSLLFSRHIERRVAEDLEREALRLVAEISVDSAGKPQLAAPPADPRYDSPVGGRYWQLTTAGGTARSLSLWDEELPSPSTPPTDQWRVGEATGPFNQRVMVLERAVSVQGARGPVTVQLAQNIADLRVARNQFRRELGLFLTGLWLMNS